MFDIGSSELLLIIVVAIVVIGPKELPRALYKLGQVIGKARGMARHFRTGFDAMIREAELEELQKQWAAQNQKIMDETRIPDFTSSTISATDEPAPAQNHDASADASGLQDLSSQTHDSDGSAVKALPSEIEAFETPSSGTTPSAPAKVAAAQASAAELPRPQTVVPDPEADKALLDAILTGNVPATSQVPVSGQASLPLDAPSESKGPQSA